MNSIISLSDRDLGYKNEYKFKFKQMSVLWCFKEKEYKKT